MLNRPFTRNPYPAWYRKLPIVVFLPWRNLGCLGIRIGPFYMDVFRTYRWFPFGLFVSTPKLRAWITLWRARVERY